MVRGNRLTGALSLRRVRRLNFVNGLKLLTGFLFFNEHESSAKIHEYPPKVGNTGACSFAAIWLLKSWRSVVTSLSTSKVNYCKKETIRFRSPIIYKPHGPSAYVSASVLYLQPTKSNRPSTTSPVNTENLAPLICSANSNIELARETGESHLCSPLGPAGIAGGFLLSAKFLQHIGFVQLVSEPG